MPGPFGPGIHGFAGYETADNRINRPWRTQHPYQLSGTRAVHHRGIRRRNERIRSHPAAILLRKGRAKFVMTWPVSESAIFGQKSPSPRRFGPSRSDGVPHPVHDCRCFVQRWLGRERSGDRRNADGDLQPLAARRKDDAVDRGDIRVVAPDGEHDMVVAGKNAVGRIEADPADLRAAPY